jgi:PIN domain nuclease of toxin-antitoxin system
VIVLDASAMLALLFDESGAETVRDTASGEDAVAMSAANYSEVLQKVEQRGGDVDATASRIEAMVRLEPVTGADAVHAARLWRKGQGLSLGDRLCLALARRLDCEAYTMDAEWARQPCARVVEREAAS